LGIILSWCLFKKRETQLIPTSFLRSVLQMNAPWLLWVEELAL
jgi:hypothetical protein